LKPAAIFLNGTPDISANHLTLLKTGNYDIFCADGGANFLYKLNLIPKLMLGDFDSIASEAYEYLKDKTEIHEFPKEKDFTDGELIVDKVLELGYQTIDIFAAMGGLTSHFLGNLFLLKKSETIRILNSTEEVFWANKSFKLINKKGQRFSIIPLAERVEGLTLSGFKYETSNITISQGQTHTLGNLVTENAASVTFNLGDFICVLESI
jgi:thiamine pyrophosphokinase